MHKFFYRLFIQGIQIGLTVIPGIILIYYDIGIPHLAGGFLLRLQAAIVLHKMIAVKGYGVSAQKISAGLFSRIRHPAEFFKILSKIPAAVRIRAVNYQRTAPVAVIFCNKAARRPGRPTVFVIQPAKHILFFCLFIAQTNQAHKLFA